MNNNPYLKLSEDGKTLIRCDKSASGEIAIPEGVTQIRRGALNGCSLITSIVIPSSMIRFIPFVFDECISLKSFIVDENNRYYHSVDGVIYAGNTLVRVPLGVGYFEIPAYIKSIESYAFSGCTNLISVKLFDTITSIGAGAFSNCTNLTSMTCCQVHAGFKRDLATSIEIPYSITEIKHNVFKGCTKLNSVEIPTGVTKIGMCAFEGCSNLMSINIPDSVTNIANGAFNECSKLSSVEISYLTNFANNAFESYTKINKRFWSLTADGRELIDCDNNASGTIILSRGIAKIGDKAFQNCKKITALEIPDSVTEIGDSAFQFCDNLLSVEIPSSVTNIGNYAFSCCSSLQNIEIPNGVIKIGHWAFEHCTSLSSISIPSSVIEIGCDVITGCTGLNKIIIDKENPHLCSSNGFIYSKDKKRLFHIPESLDSFDIPSYVREIGGGAFARCSKLSSMKIPNNVKKIGPWAFQFCTNLRSVVIPNSITLIDGGTFADCISLTSIRIPNSVTLIGDWAFKGCTGLTIVSIPSSVTVIGRGIFDNCNNLYELHLRHKIPIDFSMSFNNLDLSKITLYVPIGSGYDYRHHPYYSKFAKVMIEE